MIIIADLHLGRENDSLVTPVGPSQMVDSIHRLEWILNETVRRGQIAIAVAGDVFNKVNPTTRYISIFFDWLTKCQSAGVSVYIIGGNHDAGVDWMNMTMVQNANLDRVHVFTAPAEVEVSDGCGCNKVLFWPHMPLAQRELVELTDTSVSAYVARMFPEARLVVTHGQVVSSAYTNDIFFEAGDAMTIDPSAFKKAKRIVAGHIHNATRYGIVKYPGSMLVNTFGEVDESKGFVDLDLASGEVTWYPFPEDDVVAWRHVELDLTDKDETSLDEEVIKELADGAVVKVTVIAKRHGVIDESAIRSLFNKYGRVTRFETRIEGQAETVVSRERKSHTELLADYLKDQKEAPEDSRDRALVVGAEIIERCMGD